MAEARVVVHGIPRQFKSLELAPKPFPVSNTDRKLIVTQETTQVSHTLGPMKRVSVTENTRSPHAIIKKEKTGL